VRTLEDRAVFALAHADQPWLMVECAPPRGRAAAVWFIVDQVPDRPGETLEARVTVRSNGNQRFVVPVYLTVAGARRPSAVAAPPVPVYAAVPIPPHPAEVVPPVADLDSAAEGDDRGSRPGRFRHLLPAGVLALVLLGMFVRDSLYRGKPPPVVEGEGTPALVDPLPRVTPGFHDSVESDPDRRFLPVPTMRFGLVTHDPKDPNKVQRLTYDPRGVSNNTCMRIDGTEYLFGLEPGRWVERQTPLGKDPAGRERQGFTSVWTYDREKVFVTQAVEVVPGQVSRLLDTCLVRYTVENRDNVAHRVGLRFLLDTFIGGNDGVPFTLPGSPGLCDTQREFNTPDQVPDFIQALEHEDLAHPGTIANLQLKLGGRVEPPARVTLGAWPNRTLRDRLRDRRFDQHMTLWDVPVVSMKTLPTYDSAVVMYWPERELTPGEKRELGFAYGLGTVASGEGGGKLGLTVGGRFTVGSEFTVTAYVTNPTPGQRLTLRVPDGLQLQGDADQAVPAAANASSRNSPVTWKVRAARVGRYTLRVESSTGGSQSQAVTVTERGVFD
jgi:hypothetical protein